MPYTELELEKISWSIANRMRGTIDPKNVYPLAYLAYCALQGDDPYNLELAIRRASNNDSDVKDALEAASSELAEGLKFQELVMCINSFDVEAIAEYLKHGPFTQSVFDLESTTPDGIARLAASVLRIQPGDRVVDFGCGQGSFLEAVASSQPDACLAGVDANRESLAVAKMRAFTTGSHVDYSHGDMFWYYEGRIKENPVDKAFSNYPWGMRTKALKPGSEYLDKILKGEACYKRPLFSDWIFNRLLVDSLKVDGTAVAIMSNGATFNGVDKPVRKYFVENGFIEAIVALPAGVFAPYTNIETSLVVLRPGGISSVRFVDATDLGDKDRRSTQLSEADIEKILDRLERDSDRSEAKTIDEIAARDFDLSAKRYLEAEIDIPNGAELSSLCEGITRGATVRAAELDAIACNEDTGISYLNLGNVSDGYIDGELPNLKELDPKMEKYCIQDGDVLVSKSGAPFKIAVAEVPEGRKVLANGNLYVISVDKAKIDPYYLAAYLVSPIGKELLARMAVGTSIPSIPIKALSALRVPVAGMERQKEIGTAYLAKLDEIKVLKLRLQQARQEMVDLFEGC